MAKTSNAQVMRDDYYGELGEFIIIQDTPSDIINTLPQDMLGTTTQFNWSNNHTKLFLDAYKKYKPKVGTYPIKTLKKLWEVLANELNQILNTNVSPGNCENRWRVLERAYKKYIDSKNKTGESRKCFEYAEDMDEIFKGKRNVKPELLLSATTVQNMPEEEFANQDVIESEPSTSKMTPGTPTKPLMKKETKLKRKTPVVNRNLTLASMKKDRKEYYEERLRIEREKIQLLKEKLLVMKERNVLLKERNAFYQRKI